MILVLIFVLKNAIAFTWLATLPSHQRRNAYFSSSKVLQPIPCDGRESIITRNFISPLFAASSNIEISQVQSNADIVSLADLRYQEWILEDNDSQNDTTVTPREKPSTAPSQTSFRFATEDVYQERRAEGALVFLAKYNNKDHLGVDERNTPAVVGAAELSPIEIRNCIQICGAQDIECAPMAMYATDVVTSRSHRRLGIGSKLMSALDDTARSLNCRFLFLHVKHDNVAAVNFYHGLGYLEVTSNNTAGDVEGLMSFSITRQGLSISPVNKTASRIPETETINGFTKNEHDGNPAIIVNTRQLAVNAGTVGQLLMVKPLLDRPSSYEMHYKRITASNSVLKPAVSTSHNGRGGGFAKLKQRKRTKKG
ncbi:hypothetical protein HJC23_000477 [Cyclotella cryptica]|uniref:N-acetyltransferase domain-containing protein n=1 Tax=Cyclotella cryptica TaxID=29204 RepID=A0ABD3Q9U8_9STRA